MKKLILCIALSGSLITFGQTDTPCTPTTAPQTGGCVTSSTAGATPSFGTAMSSLVGCGNGYPGTDVWYSFTADGTQWTYNLTNSTGNPLGIALFNLSSGDPCGSATFGTLHTNCTTSTGTISGSYSSLVVGQTYYVLIVSQQKTSGPPGNPNLTPITNDFTLCGTSSTPASTAPNTDCATATALCSSSTQNGNSNGFGAQELSSTNQGCISFGGEKQSSWYTFTAQTTGTFTMDISPQNGTDDYDFALWGPNSACPPTSTPIRCDFAGGGGNTGIGSSGTNNSEDAGGSKYVKTLNITAGQTYILLINNFSSSSQPFTLAFGGTASLDCSVVLPIELKSFEAKATYSSNLIQWITGSERNSDYFILETSSDGYDFKQIANVKGAGNSNVDKEYSYVHQNPEKRINYYRLTEVDINGVRTAFNMISIDNESAVQLIRTVNLFGQEVNNDTKGIVFEYYSDGTVLKVYHN
jgi:hypothetical protein